MKSKLPLIALALSLALPLTAQADSNENHAKQWASMFSRLNDSARRFVVVAYEQTTYKVNDVKRIEASGRFLIITYRGHSGSLYKAIVDAEKVIVISSGP